MCRLRQTSRERLGWLIRHRHKSGPEEPYDSMSIAPSPVPSVNLSSQRRLVQVAVRLDGSPRLRVCVVVSVSTLVLSTDVPLLGVRVPSASVPRSSPSSRVLSERESPGVSTTVHGPVRKKETEIFKTELY